MVGEGNRLLQEERCGTRDELVSAVSIVNYSKTAGFGGKETSAVNRGAVNRGFTVLGC